MNFDSIKRWIAIFTASGVLAPLCSSAEIIDYHQHLYSPEAGARSSPWPNGIDAAYLVAQLDAAGIGRAVVLSVAYSFSNPNKPLVPDEYARVRAENDWTGAQVAKYPHRLIGFCSVNPLRSYALKEIARCSKDPALRTGLKLHFGNSDVNVDNPDHLARVRRVFHVANKYRMAIVVHLHANIDHHRPYGAEEARIFLEQLLPEAPDVPVQIAHLAGGGGYAVARPYLLEKHNQVQPDTSKATFQPSRADRGHGRTTPGALSENARQLRASDHRRTGLRTAVQDRRRTSARICKDSLTETRLPCLISRMPQSCSSS
jgi:predicted TIM-barrel fold metal-dependent hydrolase